MRRIITAALFLTVACLSSPAAARVERIEILSRQDFAPGIEFGDAGAYEKLRGRAFFALDPNAAANAPVTDLKLAPRDARGLVEFSAEFLVLRPKVTARGNGTLLYEVNNRGNIAILRQLHEASFSNDPATVADAGNGFLFRRGVTLVWSAWATDVATRPGDNRLVLRAPIATKDGAPITGKVAYELIVDAPRVTARFTGLLGTAYPFANDGDPDVVLTERQRRADERRPIPRAAWSFVEPSEGGAASEIALDGGFKPGRIYELVYTARDPIVAAAGMAGIRDLLSYLRNHPLAGAPAPRTSLIFGISQSGRLIQTMLLRGLHVDEDGRAVFDGAFVHVAGGGKGGFDYRFAMPTRHFSVLEDHIYPTDFFPFATVSARDSATGAEGSILDRARALGAVPKLFYVNNSSEYWNRAASLIATDPDGERDLPPAPEARIYLIAGAQHYVGALSERGIFANCVNTLNHYRAMRALMLAFERWVRDGVEPPPSTYRASPTVRWSRSPPMEKPSPEFPISVCPRETCARHASTSAAGSRPIASPSRCHHAWENRSRPWCRGRTPTGWIRAASRCPKCSFRSAPGPASTPATRPLDSPAPPAGGTARSCRLRAPRRSGRHQAIRDRRSKPAMSAVPRMRKRCERPPPTWSAGVFCCRRTSMRW